MLSSSHTDPAAPSFSGQDSSQSSPAPSQGPFHGRQLSMSYSRTGLSLAFPALQALLQGGCPMGCSPSGTGCSSLNPLGIPNSAPAQAPLSMGALVGALSQCCSTAVLLCVRPRPGSSEKQTQLLNIQGRSGIKISPSLPASSSCPEAFDLSDPVSQDSGQGITHS